MKNRLLLILLLMPGMTYASNWECILPDKDVDCVMMRMKTGKGWIVDKLNYPLIYVPDEHHTWSIEN